MSHPAIMHMRKNLEDASNARREKVMKSLHREVWGEKSVVQAKVYPGLTIPMNGGAGHSEGAVQIFKIKDTGKIRRAEVEVSTGDEKGRTYGNAWKPRAVTTALHEFGHAKLVERVVEKGGGSMEKLRAMQSGMVDLPDEHLDYLNDPEVQDLNDEQREEVSAWLRGSSLAAKIHRPGLQSALRTSITGGHAVAQIRENLHSYDVPARITEKVAASYVKTVGSALEHASKKGQRVNVRASEHAKAHTRLVPM